MVHISKLLLPFLHQSLSVCLPQTAQDILKDAAGFSYSHCRVDTNVSRNVKVRPPVTRYFVLPGILKDAPEFMFTPTFKMVLLQLE